MESVSQLHEEYARKDADYYGQHRDELINFIPPAARTVLDVGCGEGTFGRSLKTSRNCEVWGIEPSIDAAATAGQFLDHVINDTLLGALSKLGGRRFDAVCFNDVLEHMPDPEEALRAAKAHLADDGRIIASIPNVLFFPIIKELLFDQDWKYRESGVMDNTHLRFFTKKSIVRLFEECGYEICEIQGINPHVTKSYRLANLVLMNHLSDWKYLQFAVVAKLKAERLLLATE